MKKAHHIPVAFFCVELDSETSGIAFRVSRSLLAADGRKTSEHWSALADRVEELRLADFLDVVGDLEVSPSASTFSVNDSFGNALTIEVSKLVDQVEVLEEESTVLTSSHGVLIVIDW